jgi:hypothetical protein
MGCLKNLSLMALPLALGAAGAGADTLGYGNWDTRADGSFQVVANSNDGNGSLELTVTNPTVAGQDKVAVIFGQAGLAPLGLLDDLTGFSLEAFKASSPATGSAADFAYRLQLANGHSLVYENAYNGSAAVPLDTWRSLDLLGGNFWLYDGVNHNGGSDAHPLSFYSGSEGSQSVIGVQVAYGSGLGAFDGNVDNLHLDFAGGASFDAPVSTPLPSTALGGLACLGLLGGGTMIRRRRANA